MGNIEKVPFIQIRDYLLYICWLLSFSVCRDVYWTEWVEIEELFNKEE